MKDSVLILARRVVPSPDVIKRLAECFGTGDENVIVAAAIVGRIEIAGVVARRLHVAHHLEVIAKIEGISHSVVSNRPCN